MPPRSDKACDVVVLEAVKDAHTRAGRNFQHKCHVARNAMNSTPTPGARVNQYNSYVSDGITITTLLDEKETYGICSNMKKKIDDALKKRDREAAAAANNTTNTRTPHRIPPVLLVSSAELVSLAGLCCHGRQI